MTPIPLELLCTTFLRCAKQNTQIILPPIQNTGDLYRFSLNAVKKEIISTEKCPQVGLLAGFGGNRKAKMRVLL